ncbi:MAG: hypothetical protein QXQ14_00650 [Candidatus Aenigmatarchaeota archaeon]
MDIKYFENKLFDSMEKITNPFSLNPAYYNSFLHDFFTALKIYMSEPLLLFCKKSIFEYLIESNNIEKIPFTLTFYLAQVGAIKFNNDKLTVDENVLEKCIRVYLDFLYEGNKECIDKKLEYHKEKWEEFYSKLEDVMKGSIVIIEDYSSQQEPEKTTFFEIFKYTIEKIKEEYSKRISEFYLNFTHKN